MCIQKDSKISIFETDLEKILKINLEPSRSKFAPLSDFFGAWGSNFTRTEKTAIFKMDEDPAWYMNYE